MDNIKIGDILDCHWGYSMILVDFVRVKKICGKTIIVEELVKRNVGNGGYGQPDVIPTDTVETQKDYSTPGEIKLVKIEHRLYPTKGNTKAWFHRKGGFGKYYYPWDGTPQREDHND